ncbi:MAG: hypothetical protein VW397_00270 [Candidatus Margulisiibacteriota bacterium]
MVWSGNSFKSINPSSTEIKFQNEKLYFAEPLFVSNNALGIGVSPSETLDVNGTIRMRTQALSSLSNVSAGSLIFDGSNFLGWNGTHWKNLSASSNINTVEPDSYWIYDDVHLIASPNHNVGIKISNPQATLDINGNLRIRSTLNSGMSDFLTINSFGDVGQHSLNIQDLISNTVTTSIQLIGNQLILSSMNANEGDFLVYQNEQWRPINLTTSALLTYSDHHLDISTANLVNDSILLFRNNQWDYFSLPTTNSNIVFNNGWAFSLEDSNTDDIFIVKNGEWVRKTLVSDQILHADNGLRLASQNAVLGQQLTWNGDSWIPSNNSSILFNGENGVVVEGNTIKLANNLAWTGSKFTIGTTSGAEFKINRLTSTLSSPIQLVNASNQTLLNVNNSGQLSIGYNGVHSGYSIASNGVNLFAHSLSRYQSSVGTTNIGTAEFGPTLLIASVPTANPSPSRSIIEVLDVNGTSRFEVQDGGNVGISTGSPQATLDINGFAKLKKYSSQPKSCTTETDGAIALTSSYRLCVCDSTKWVNSNDGISLCEW